MSRLIFTTGPDADDDDDDGYDHIGDDDGGAVSPLTGTENAPWRTR